MDPLSYAQRRFWFNDQLGGALPLYNVTLPFRISGRLDVEALGEAVSDLAGRHDVLRTVFRQLDGEVRPAEKAVAAGTSGLPLVDVAASELDRAIRAEAERPFDLAEDLPIRATLFRIDDGEYGLSLVFHHIAIDAWSAQIYLRELGVAYAQRRAGTEPRLPSLPMRYSDYAVWQRGILGDASDAESPMARGVDYWSNRLANLPEQLDLPYDRAFAADVEHTAGTIAFTIRPEVHRRLADMARELRTSLFVIGQTALAAWLAGLGGGSDVPLGTVFADRGDEDLENLVGPFINTLILRTDLTGDPTFTEAALRSRQSTLEDFEHGSVPFEAVVEAVKPTSRDRMFQAMYTWVTTDVGTPHLTLDGLDVEAVPFEIGLAKFDLAVDLEERRENGLAAGIGGTLTYDESIFDRATAESMATMLATLVEQVAADPDRRMSEIDMLGEEERRLLNSWNDTATAYDETDLPSMFGDQVRRTPDAVAVETEEESLTYRQLDAHANRLAHLLIRHGAGPETSVAVVVPRATALLAMLAVLKTGATFLPIDPAYPHDRISFILDDAAPTLILAVEENLGAIGERGSIVLDRPHIASELAGCPETDPGSDRPAPLSPDSPAYIIYTSGSTGRPKGVLVTARVLINLLSWQTKVMDCRAGTRVSQFSAISFDAFEEEILAALFSGQTVVIPSEDTRRDPTELVKWLRRCEVNEFLAPETVVRAVIEEALEQDAHLPHLRTLIQGGEPFQLTNQVREFRRRHPGLAIWNHYGPSETHVVTGLPLPDDPRLWPTVAPIGRPIWNCQTYVLDTRLRQVPIGVAGELYIAGAQLARGYLGRAGLTAQRFVANPFGEPGSRMYRTGDVVRWNRRGELVFVGRADDQIKIRGIRVELSEVNSVLGLHPGVAQVATAVREHPVGEKKLISYFVPEPEAAPDAAELRRHAAVYLPAALVPSAFVALDVLPMNANGKLDRLALPVPDLTAQPSAPHEGRLSATGEKIRTIFSEVLEVGTVNADDSFFDIGGHSMLAVRVVKRIRAELGVEIALRTLFESPTVRELTALTGGRSQPTRGALTAGPRPESIPLSFAQQRLWLIDLIEGPSPSYNLPLLACRLAGRLDPAALESALNDVIARHESLRTVYPAVRGVPYQRILPVEDARIVMSPLVVEPGELDERVRRAFAHRFVLASDLPIRAELFSLSPEEHVFVLVAHHIAVDGSSMEPLLRDLANAYSARRDGRTPVFTPLALQYADFAVWQRETLGDDGDPTSVAAKQAAVWRQALADLPDALDLPMDRPRPDENSMRGADVRFSVDGEVYKRVRSLARAEGATPFMVIQAAVATLLSQSGVGSDIPLGTTIAGRSEAALDDLVGCFINLLVLRTDTSADPTFRELLARARQVDLEAFANQDIPFDHLVRILKPKRQLDRHPLFQVMITMRAAPRPFELDGLESRDLAVDTDSAANFELTFAFEEQAETHSLSGVVQYSTDLFDPETVETLVARLVAILDAAAARPDTTISTLACEPRRG